jgi:hypothetical protein
MSTHLRHSGGKLIKGSRLLAIDEVTFNAFDLLLDGNRKRREMLSDICKLAIAFYLAKCGWHLSK